MAAGGPTKIYGDGGQTRDFVYVDDVVSGLMAAAATGGVFNIGSGAETSVLELHDRCRAVAGDSVDPELAPARDGDLVRSALDVSLASRELGWQPQHSFDATGLAETVEWYRENREWWEPIKSGEYRAYYEQQYAARLAD